MSAPERMCRIWARTYTVGLPGGIRDERLAELDSDLYEHRVLGGHGSALVGRTMRGVADDVLWRFREGRSTARSQAFDGSERGWRALWATVTQAWFPPIAVLLVLFNTAFAIAVLFDENARPPGQVVGPIIVLTITVGMIAGLAMRRRAIERAGANATLGAVVEMPSPTSSARGRAASRAEIAVWVFGVVVIVCLIVGTMTSPFLVGVGILALIAVVVLGTRARRMRKAEPASVTRPVGQHQALLADVLIVVGTLPALGMFWMIVPAILAVVVIFGALGTGPRLRSRAAY